MYCVMSMPSHHTHAHVPGPNWLNNCLVIMRMHFLFGFRMTLILFAGWF